MDKRLLIHIGYHKTATTWMQKLLFIPQNGYRQIADHSDVFSLIVKPHGLKFDPSLMQSLITNSTPTLAKSEVPVISSEILCGNPFFGGRESDIYAERLHAIVPNARILISIRSQMRILPSVYMQYLLRGGTMGYKKFFEGVNEPGYFAFNSDHFEYDRLIALYQRLFGADNVLVTSQESLKANMGAVAQNIADFSHNTTFEKLSKTAYRIHAASYPEHAVPILRRINHIQKSQMNPAPLLNLGETPKGLYRAAGYILKRPPINPLFSSYKPVSNFVRNHFQGRFSESNARLSELTQGSLDLSEYDGESSRHKKIHLGSNM